VRGTGGCARDRGQFLIFLAVVVEWIEHPAIKWFLPWPMLAAMAPLIWLFFRRTWRALDEEAFVYRRALHERGELDYRPVVALVLGALVLTFQEYYGRFNFWEEHLRVWVQDRFVDAPATLDQLEIYNELLGRCWWALTRIGGYLLPLMVWRLFFRRDSLLDMGLRTRGFLEHAWLYALFVTVMVPVLLIVARQPDFGAYYPICETAGRSWLDFAIWELVYLGQFLGLEIFFRGWWIRATRVFGVGAIFCMVVPYCMIHYGKPYLEAAAAIIAGTVLGSLSMKTRSIWAGFLVHGTVGFLMDVLSLDRKNALPTLLTARSTRRLMFPYWHWLIWGAWVLALAVLLFTAWQRRALLRAALARLRPRSA
jgi:membrane protease YdiL (CAAX protease family)